MVVKVMIRVYDMAEWIVLSPFLLKVCEEKEVGNIHPSTGKNHDIMLAALS